VLDYSIGRTEQKNPRQKSRDLKSSLDDYLIGTVGFSKVIGKKKVD
jgi:hypothetical protein